MKKNKIIASLMFVSLFCALGSSSSAQNGIIGRGQAWNVAQNGQATSLMGNFVKYSGGNSKFGWFARIFLGGGRYIDASKESQTGDTEVFSWVLYSEVRLTGTRDSRTQQAYMAGQFVVQKSIGFGWSRTTYKKSGGRWYSSVSSWSRVRFTK